MKKIFIVDDNDTNRVAAKQALESHYKTYAFASAERMFQVLEKIIPDLILLDIEMPDVDGFEAQARLKENPKLSKIPVVFLTANHDPETEMHCLESGALDFITKPFATSVLQRRIKMHIETDLLIKESQQNLRDIQNATICVIAEMVENRDKSTGGHIVRTQKYLEILINELLRSGIYAGEIATWDLVLALPSAQLHDVGKITISDTILNKPGKLTDEEFTIIKTHAEEGTRIIDKMMALTNDDGFLTYAKLFAGYHHERWDGSGYPYALKGAQIPLEGRILAVADVYDALVSARSYKKPFTHEEAVLIIKKDSGTHFDPLIVEAFLNIEQLFRCESEGRL